MARIFRYIKKDFLAGLECLYEDVPRWFEPSLRALAITHNGKLHKLKRQYFESGVMYREFMGFLMRKGKDGVILLELIAPIKYRVKKGG